MADENEREGENVEQPEAAVSEPEAPVGPSAPSEPAEVPAGEDEPEAAEPGEVAPTEIPAAEPETASRHGDEPGDPLVETDAPTGDAPDAVGEPDAVEPAEDVPGELPEVSVNEDPVSETPFDEPAATAEEAPPEDAAEAGVAEPAAEDVAPAQGAGTDAPAEASAPDAVAEAAPAPAEQKRKKKRLPRALRPKRTRRAHEQTGERKPIVRLPKPEQERGRRQERRGVVVSSSMDKTIVVKVDTVKAHPRYKKVVRRSTKFHAHDEENAANVGDVVRIVETRPLSKTKNWRLAEVVEAAR